MAFLTGIPSLTIRELAMARMMTALIQGDDSAINGAEEIYRDGARQHSARDLNLAEYWRRMKLSAMEGGLWADTTSVTWAANATNTRIHVYQYASFGNGTKNIQAWQGFGLERENTTHIHLLFTGNDLSGHYTPLIPLTGSPITVPGNHRAQPAPHDRIVALKDASLAVHPHTNIAYGTQHTALMIIKYQRNNDDNAIVRQLQSVLNQLQPTLTQQGTNVNLPEITYLMRIHLASCGGNLSRAQRALTPEQHNGDQRREDQMDLVDLALDDNDIAAPPPATAGPTRERRDHTCDTAIPSPSKHHGVGPMELDTGIAPRDEPATTHGKQPHAAPQPGILRKLKDRASRAIMALWLNNPPIQKKKPILLPYKKGPKPSSKTQKRTDKPCSLLGTQQKKGNIQPTIEEAWKPKPPRTITLPPLPEAPPLPCPPPVTTEKPEQVTPSKLESLLLNVMGLLCHEDEVNAMINDTRPPIFVLTETKLKKGMSHNATGQRLRTRLFSGYRIHFSIAPTDPERGSRGKAGLVMGVGSDLAPVGSFSRINNPDTIRLSGYLLHCTLTRKCPLLRPPLNIIGVYMPEDMNMRREIYSYINKITDHCARSGEDLQVMGDFNAVLLPTDRTGPLDEADELHRSECSRLCLVPAGTADPGRAHTYHKAQHPSAPTCSGRLDDNLGYRHPGAPPRPPMPERVLEPGGTLDHKALLTAIPTDLLPCPPREHGLAPEPRGPSLVYPIKRGELEDTKIAVAESIEIHDLWMAIREFKNTAFELLGGDHSSQNVIKVGEELRRSHDSHAIIDRFGASVTGKCQEAHKIMMDKCAKETPTSNSCFNRRDNRKFRTLLTWSKALKHFLAVSGIRADLGPQLHELQATYPAWPSETIELGQARETASAHLKALHERMQTLRQEKTKRMKEAARESFQSRLAKQTRRTLRTIKDAPDDDDPTASHPEIKPGEAFHDGPPDGKNISTDPTRVIDIISDFFTNLFAPPGHAVNTGRYMPEEREPGFTYPFERAENPDNFKLGPSPGCADPKSADLLEIVMDQCTFKGRLSHCGRNKMPGPDRIPNELLKSLPDIWHETIHDLFVIMWITGRTPSSWTESTTILLHKKGDKFLPGNFRPIGLAGTLYKLWTSNVTHVMLHHALRNNMLHVCQEGGILQRSSHRQLENLINAFEDAHHTKQDIFLTYLDFSSAFNMVNHDQLLRTMYDIGLPRDAIEVVKDLYSEHRTTISLPVGKTNPITVTRGTIQGDPLSPLLFLIYIEPLLRWLHVGGRGYKFGCLGDAKDSEGFNLQEVHQLAGLGFVDDTTCMTRTKEDMAIQIRKVEAFSSPEGFNLPVNNTKSATTAILYGTAATYGGSAAEPERLARLLGHSNALTINGQPIPYYPPEKTYRYLGLNVCPGMDWTVHLDTVIKEVVTRGRQLAASMASPRQCLHIIKTCLRPKITYAFSIAPYTMQEIGRLDRTLAGITRRCCRLPRSMPTASMVLSTEKAGMGLISLAVDYAQAAAQNLTQALNDTGRLGLVTKSLLLLQRERMGGAPVDELPTGSARYCTNLRKLMVMERHDLQLTIDNHVFSCLPPQTKGPSCPPAPPGAQWSKRFKTATATSTMADNPDGWFSCLLHHSGVTPAFMAPLLALGIRHVGQLVTASGTHLVSTLDLALLPGVNRKVTNRDKHALNRLSVAITGVYPSPSITLPSQMRTADPLPAKCRALPPHLAMPATHTTRFQTLDVRQYLSRVAAPPEEAAIPKAPRIEVTKVKKLTKKAFKASLQSATHRQYDRTTIKIGREHISPADVHEASPPGTLATFWQQRQELVCNLVVTAAHRALGTDHALAHWQSTAKDPTCTWEQFRQYVCFPNPPGAPIALPIELLASMYDPQYKMTAIKGPFHYKLDGQAKEGYSVSWADTVICRHHLPMIVQSYQHKGHIVPSPDLNTTDYPTFVRDSHTSFLTMAGSDRGAPPPDLVLVQWDDLTSDAKDIIGHENFDELLELHQQTLPCRQARPPPGPTDTHLPDHIRQGIPTRIPFPEATWKKTRRERSLIAFETQACNPDMDIGVTKQYTLQEGLRLPGTTAPLPHTVGITYSHSPAGTFLGQLLNSVLDKLRQQYEISRYTHPEVHATQGTCFEKDVARLLMRYDPNKKNKKILDNLSVPPPHLPSLALPHLMWQALKDGLGIEHELFASPLDRNTLSTSYCSAFEDDMLFGANHDAYSRPWTGACQAYIGEGEAANDKAIRHAIGSVETNPKDNTCIIMFIPSGHPEAPFMRHLSHPRVHVLLKLGSEETNAFLPPGHWQGKPATSAFKPPALQMIAISTVSGAETHTTDTRLEAFRTIYGIGLNPPPTIPPPPTAEYTFRIPKAIRRMHAADSPPPLHGCPLPATLIPHPPLPCTHPLSGTPDKDTVVAYTDGSCRKNPDGSQSIGAAVYFPDTTGTTQDGGPVTVTINPNGHGPTYTINWSELSAIHQALLSPHSVGARTLRLYTDSACSISLIQRILYSPWTVRDSKHFHLLTDILTALRTRVENGDRTILHKVRSHIGIVGNEAADKGAKRALNPHRHDVTESSNNRPYDGKVWVAHARQPNESGPPLSTPRYLSNLTQDPKQKITPKHSGGQFTATGIYAQLWNNVIDTLNPSSISRIWTDAKITWYQAILAQKARWGQLYTNKLAFRYGHVKNDLCPCCKMKADSIGHMLGGCEASECKAITIERHNEAARIIHRTITKYSKFGGCFCILDACPASNLPPGVDGTRLPAWMLPEGHPYGSELVGCRPDMLIIEGLPSNVVRGKSITEMREVLLQRPDIKIHIIEFGYCADTAHRERDEEKREQHDRLVRILTGRHLPPRSEHFAIDPTALATSDDANRPTPLFNQPTDQLPKANTGPQLLKTSFTINKVTYHPPITLGRTGTLPKSLLDTLKNHLKVEAAAANACTSQLTRHAVHYVEKFYLHRFATMGKNGTQPRKGTG
jgi:ribonuclease HI